MPVKPKKFDRNLVVIGAGSAGLVAALVAATIRADVSLVERDRMGGDCLNTGCVPSKALIRSARFLYEARHAADLGIRRVDIEFDFAAVMARVRRVIDTIAPHDSVARYTSLGVDCLSGTAHIDSPWSVSVDGRSLSSRAIIVATGSTPSVPEIPGLDTVTCLTSDTVWDLQELPGRLVVLGGGPIGCELAQCFARFGSQVTIIGRAARLLPREDPEVSLLLERQLAEEGVQLRLGCTPARIDGRDSAGQVVLPADSEAHSESIAFDRLLLATGRSVHTGDLGLEALGIQPGPRGELGINARMQTSVPSIFACGDVTGHFQFTHAASRQAWYAAINALLGWPLAPRLDESIMPWATFTSPEIARVGLNEQAAKALGVPYDVTVLPLARIDRAITDEATGGFIKVLTQPGRDRVLGATIAGEHAGELIAEYVAAMSHGVGLKKMLATIRIYPTWSEAGARLAGEWRRAHAPQWALALAGRYHRWRRGQ